MEHTEIPNGWAGSTTRIHYIKDGVALCDWRQLTWGDNPIERITLEEKTLCKRCQSWALGEISEKEMDDIRKSEQSKSQLDLNADCIYTEPHPTNSKYYRPL